MKWRDLVEGQSEESSFITMAILQSNNDTYAKVLKYIMDRADDDISEEIVAKIRVEMKSNKYIEEKAIEMIMSGLI